MRTYDTMPKVELHLHLEGAVPLDTMWTLAEARGFDSEVASRQEFFDRFIYADFADFIATWKWKNRFLGSYTAFTEAAEAVARSLARQNILYAEVYFSPSDFGDHGLAPAELAVAIRRGLDRVPDTDVALIVDVVRDTGPQRAGRTFDAVREAASDAGVIGITIGGSEAEFPAELFAPLYARAREAGFRLTAHAGEAAGPESVWSALRSLGVERIGHGVRSVEDDRLLARLVSDQVPLEVCPTSNVLTGVVDGWADHPVQRLVSSGAMVTLNSDDPAMFGCTLAGEYGRVADLFGFGEHVMRRLSHNAVDASWADQRTKARLRRRVEDWWNAQSP